MTREDLERAVKISKEYNEIYERFVGLAGISEYVHLSLLAFMSLFEDFNISEHGATCGDFKLSTKYNGVVIMCLASYDDMLKFKKTKEYLKERLNG